MANRGQVKQFFSIEEFEKQRQAVTDGIKEYIDLVGKVKPIRVELQKADNIKSIVDNVRQLSTEQDKLSVTTTKVVNSQRELDKAMLEAKTAKQAYNKELKAEIELETALEGSMRRARAEIKALTAERENLNITTAEGKKRAEEINAAIDKNNEFLRKNSSELEKQKINVGNYAGSAKIIVEAFERARQKVQQFSTQLGPTSPEARAARVEFEALERITGNPQFLNIAAKVGDTNKELRFFTQRLNELEDAGMKNSQVYADVRSRLAQLTDQISDTKSEIKALSSDTRNFDLFAGSVNFAADAFQTFAGAAALAGASEEDVAKQIKTLVAIQSVANGVKGIANELTTKGTAANKAYAFVQAQVSTLTSASATATQKWGAALKTVGVGLLIAGIVKLVDMLGLFGAESKKATQQTELLNKQLEAQKKFLDQLSASYSYSIDLSNARLKAQGATEKQLYDNTLKLKSKELEDLKSIEKNKIDLRIKAEEEYNKRLQVVQKAKRAYGKNAKVTFEDGLTLEDLEKQLGIRREMEFEARNATVKKQQEIDKIAADEEVRVYEEKENKKKELSENARKAAEDAEKERLRIIEANQAAAFEIEKLGIQRRIDFNQEIVDNDKTTWNDRLTAQRLAYEASVELIELEYNYKISKAGLTEKEIEQIMAESGDAKIRLDREYAKEREEIYQKLKESLTKEEKEIQAKLEDIAKQRTEKDLAELDKRLAQQKDIADKLVEIEKEKNEKIKELQKDLYDELYQTAVAFITAKDEQELAALETEKERVDAKKQQDIELVNQTIADRQKAAAEIQIIEDRAQAQKEQLEARQRQVEIRKANTERLANAARVVGDTVMGVTSLSIRSAEAQALGYKMLADPLTAAYAPISFANAAAIKAQIPFVIGVGAAQLARLMIPKYADGTDDHPGGAAIIGDGGKRELVITPDGKSFISDNKPQYAILPRGTQVFPDADKAMTVAMHEGYERRAMSLTDKPYFSDKNITRELKGMRKDLFRAIEKIPQPILTVPSVISKRVRYGDSSNTYLNNNLQS